MTSFGGNFGTERGLVFRPPSTANLMIDSADRPNPSTTTPFDFQITRSQSLLNGFFTRVATTEVVLEWCETNVEGEVIFDVSGAASRQLITIGLSGNYTMEQTMDAIVDYFNQLPEGTTEDTRPVGCTISVLYDNGIYGFDISGALAKVQNTPLAVDMGLDISNQLDTFIGVIGCPDLRAYRYIDLVCNQLTYPQDLKDASSQQSTRDVLCRWYFAEDSPEQLDGYGFPILMGYKPFVRRRLFNPPKYIKWDNNLPVGNLSFQVFDENGDLLQPSNAPYSVGETNYLMTLQISEN